MWEFRTLYNQNYYRLFAFWDKRDKSSTLILATHGISKSTGKIPKKEILKAEGIMKFYFQNN
ncbi:type II toxin-antitoxin system RelE/ParE family toxin [Salegentibacter sediminis]|uniref:type II toxin-antitoxin system RelE/ParE family toxin n=1 Tax=Salegentibacter sediminis TaxID=1930251 RepID=UPI00373FD8D1